MNRSVTHLDRTYEAHDDGLYCIRSDGTEEQLTNFLLEVHTIEEPEDPITGSKTYETTLRKPDPEPINDEGETRVRQSGEALYAIPNWYSYWYWHLDLEYPEDRRREVLTAFIKLSDPEVVDAADD